MFSFMASYLLFWKTTWREKDMIHEKFKKKKKQKNAQKTLLSSAETWIEFLAWKTMKFDFLYFWKSFRELKFFKKIKNKNNPKSIGSLSRKLWPKYETSDEDNTNSASSSIFFQNFKWESTSNLFKFI